MNTLVIYESLHGNTESIAQAIAGALPSDVTLQHVSEVRVSDLGASDLLIIGAPTHGGQPSDGMKTMLSTLGASALSGTRVAAFDTRLPWRWLGLFGYAAPRIVKRLQKSGGTAVIPPEGFFVTGGEGPLKDGEAQRAADWAREIAGRME